MINQKKKIVDATWTEQMHTGVMTASDVAHEQLCSKLSECQIEDV